MYSDHQSKDSTAATAQRKSDMAARGQLTEAPAHADKSLGTSQLQALQPLADKNSQSGAIAQLQAMADKHQGAQHKPGAASGNGLPAQLKSGIENLSGMSMDDVKVNYNSSKPAQLQAHAYAQGTDIHVASGQEKHLPHEAWHVVQQKQGRVKPTVQTKGININDDQGLEKEADRMGAKAMSIGGQSSSDTISSGVAGSSGSTAQLRAVPVAQLAPDWEHYRSKEGIYGTRQAMENYVCALIETAEGAVAKHLYLSEKQRNQVASYISLLNLLLTNRINRLPDDMALRNHLAPVNKGSWSVLKAGVDNVKSWHSALNEQTVSENWKEEVGDIIAEVQNYAGIIAYYEDVAHTPEPEVGSPQIGHGNTIKLYRKMWKGEAEIILGESFKKSMGVNDNYKKYFTTSLVHTAKFQNANSTDADNEVVMEFVLDWDEYWKFAAMYGTPNQMKGALKDRNTAIMNQEQLVKGKRACFVVQDQVDEVIKGQKEHNIGIGQGNAAEFQSLIKSMKII